MTIRGNDYLPQGMKVDPENGIDMVRKTVTITTEPPKRPVEPVPVTLRERLEAYRQYVLLRTGPFSGVNQLAGILNELIERVERLEGSQV